MFRMGEAETPLENKEEDPCTCDTLLLGSGGIGDDDGQSFFCWLLINWIKRSWDLLSGVLLLLGATGGGMVDVGDPFEEVDELIARMWERDDLDTWGDDTWFCVHDFDLVSIILLTSAK